MDIFSLLFYQPVYNLLVIFYRFFGDNLGVSIILVALVTRLVILPFSIKQLKFAEESKKMNEEVKELKKKFKDDKKTLQEEMVKVQSKYLPSQLSGCLPMILQFIFLINIYHVISDIVQKGVDSFNSVAYPFVEKFSAEYVLNSDFFGIVNLTKSATSVNNEGGDILGYLVLILLVGLTQYLSTKIIFNSTSNAKSEPKDQKVTKSKDKSNPAEEDFSEIMQRTQKQLIYLFPIMIVAISFGLPMGLALYWIIQSVFVIIQQIVVNQIKKRRADMIS